MDIKSIIDSEDTPPTRKASVPIPVKSDKRPSPAGSSSIQAPAYDNRRDIRPPQPSPLQTPSRNNSHFAGAPTHDNLSSPYQRTPPFGLNNGQHPYAQASNQSPLYPQQGAYYPHREVNTANGPSSGRSFGPSTPSQTPTASTPGSTGVYSAFQRPTSSHSVPTPNSAQHSSNILRESPQPSNTDHRALSQAQGGQRYTSQPGTPLGPPSTYNRPSLNIQRESPKAYSHQRSLSGGAAGQHEIPDLSAATRGSPSAYREPRSSIQGHNDSHSREKSVSVSPKTRLPSVPRLNSMSAIESPHNPSVGWSGHGSPARRNPESDASHVGAAREPTLKRTPSRSVGLSGLLNAEPTNDMPEATYRPSQTKSPSNNDQDSDIEILSHEIIRKAPQSGSFIAPHQSPLASYDRQVNHLSTPLQSSNSTTSNHIHTTSPSQPSTIPSSDQVGATSRPILPSQMESTSSFRQAALKTSNGLINAPLPPVQKSSRAKKQPKRPIHEPSETEVSGNDDVLLSQPAKKKLRMGEPEPSVEKTPTQETPAKKKRLAPSRVSRYEDVPIFAQSVRGPYRTKELFEINRNGVHRDPPALSRVSNAAAATDLYHAQVNGGLAANNRNPPSQSNPMSDGILGPWEYNIANIEPLDELIKEIANFLFLRVVSDESVGVASAGGGRGLGAIFEVEAKIGRIIDNNTNDRIRLPVVSECVLDPADSSIRTRFESSMTQQQHSTLNKFLNNALVASQSPKANATPLRKPRIPMTYKHTRETDTLYGLSEQTGVQLPKSFDSFGRKQKVRITTDDKTGEILAKIIKTHVADLHVFCPKSLFDWRISVNIEMDFAGDTKDLVSMDKRDVKGDRKKDRMSYKHLAYQIDLTQVTSSEPDNKSRTHELEIEISSEEVRRQGQLVEQNKPNEYEKLIKGFVDNVRLLARHCTPPSG